jgi:hypothetical protein
MTSCIDHLIITAPSLDAGCAVVEELLGVPMQPGGTHPRMGTHNRLLRLGDDMFLEVIAIDPAARAPSRPRWFELDRLPPNAMPRLSGWVARTTDINAAAACATEDVGTIEPLTRGSLDWRITIPPDGTFPLAGAAPALIQWTAAEHPAHSLADHGLSLARLEICHREPERIRRLLDSIGFIGPVVVRSLSAGDGAYLVAHVNTLHGPRKISTPIHWPSNCL